MTQPAPPPPPGPPPQPPLPPAAPLDPDQQDPAGQVFGTERLRTAPAGGVLAPIPTVTINGVDIASSAGPAPAGQVVLDGVSVHWGRDDLISQPEPPTATIRVFDTSRTWAVASDLRGQPVTIRWDSGASTGVFFRGRIGQQIAVSLTTLTHPSGEQVTGALVELPLDSILVDLANRVPAVDWPAETVAARRTRIAAAAAAELPGGVGTRAFWDTPNVGPVTADQQVSILEHLTGLYDSTGADRYTYWPFDQTTRNVVRRDYPNVRGLGRLWWEVPGATGQARAGAGAFVRTTGAIPVGGTIATTPHYLDGAALGYDPADGVTRAPKVSRAQVSHPDEGNGYQTRVEEVAVTGVDETVTGVRTARVDSQIAWNSWAELAASDLRDLISKEGAVWRPGNPLLLRTALTGGFEYLNQAMLLLFAGETNDLIFLQRSWLPRLGVRPIFGVMGGTIAYTGGGWELELQLAPLVTTLVQHRISWEDLDPGASTGLTIRAYDTPHADGLHESVTVEDLAYVCAGLTGTIGANTGWDTYQ